MTSPAYFDEINRQLHGLLVSLPVLTPQEITEVEHFIEHFEFGEALVTLSWIIVEEDKRISRSMLAEIEQLADRMDIRSDLPDELPAHALDDT